MMWEKQIERSFILGDSEIVEFDFSVSPIIRWLQSNTEIGSFHFVGLCLVGSIVQRIQKGNHLLFFIHR